MKRREKGVVYIALYADDNIIIGNITTIDNAIEALKNKGLVLKIAEGLQDYFSCKIQFSIDKQRAWLGQPHLIQNMEKKFSGLCRIFGVTRLQIHLIFLLFGLWLKARTFSWKTKIIGWG